MKLGIYYRLRAVMNNEALTERERSMAVISIVKGVSPKDLISIPVGEYDDLADEVSEALEVKPAELKDEYEIGGIRCRLHRQVNTMTAIQFSDLLSVLKRGDNELNMPTILSILLVPVGATYPDYNRIELEEKIVDDMDVVDAMTIANFIPGLSHVLRQNIETSLILNGRTTWTGVPRWRRTLARIILEALLPRPSAKSGAGSSGSGRSPRSSGARGTRRSD